MNRSGRRASLEDHVVVEVLDREDRGAALAEIRAGLLRDPREIPPKFFYDDRGSRLFEEICGLPEYYPTRTERGLLETFSARIVERSGADVLVELGSGASAKTRILLDALRRADRLSAFVPFDVNEGVVRRAAEDFAARYPGVRVHGVVGDFMKHLEYIPDEGRRLVAFLGGTIGNLRPEEAVSMLTRVSGQMEAGECFLLGTDLVKDAGRLEAAYNDSRGVTAEFNKNILRVVNGLADGDFDPDRFAHRAFYNREDRWIEMRLRSARAQTVRLSALEMEIAFREGEEILTEISAKFDRGRVEALLDRAGFELCDWLTDPDGLFALSLSRKRRARGLTP